MKKFLCFGLAAACLASLLLLTTCREIVISETNVAVANGDSIVTYTSDTTYVRCGD